MISKEYILRVVAETIKSGGSASKLNAKKFLPPLDIWSFPKYPSRTAILPPTVDLASELQKFIICNEVLLSEPECWLGTWINPRSGEYYLDIAMGIAGKKEAHDVAKRISIEDGRKIVAIFNSKRNKTIYLWE
ncbi:MAG: hypothetical protein U0V02_05710 [Anaerolineales bacterium]